MKNLYSLIFMLRYVLRSIELLMSKLEVTLDYCFEQTEPVLCV